MHILKFQSTLSVRRATRAWRIVRSPSLFQSTLSVRRATVGVVGSAEDLEISIHALREESDKRLRCALVALNISIHALREESDHIPRTAQTMPRNFNPRSP